MSLFLTPAVQQPSILCKPLHILVDSNQCVWTQKALLNLDSEQLSKVDIASYFMHSPADFGVPHNQCHYLGRTADNDCLAWSMEDQHPLPDNYESVHLYRLLLMLDEYMFNLIGRAVQIVTWDKNHRYCGTCGQKTRDCLNEGERMHFCDKCNLGVYPRISPCAIVLVRKDNELLLANGVGHPKNMYSALAGFVEPGESLEECLCREVLEEVDINIHCLRYFSSQPWPFPHQLMLGFFADYLDGVIKPNPAEINDAAWWHYKDLPESLPGSYSIAGKLIEAAVTELAK